jgi:hypothetical protein
VGTVQELWSRHHLEGLLDALLRRHRLGECSGGGHGLGRQEIDLAISRASWQAAWELVRSRLAELGLLGRATVRRYLDDEDTSSWVNGRRRSRRTRSGPPRLPPEANSCSDQASTSATVRPHQSSEA